MSALSSVPLGAGSAHSLGPMQRTTGANNLPPMTMPHNFVDQQGEKPLNIGPPSDRRKSSSSTSPLNSSKMEEDNQGNVSLPLVHPDLKNGSANDIKNGIAGNKLDEKA